MSEPQPLDRIMAPDWAEALAPVEPQIRQMGRFLREEHADGHVGVGPGPVEGGDDRPEGRHTPAARTPTQTLPESSLGKGEQSVTRPDLHPQDDH